eukprot:08896.XXX_6348_6467_1 [CDS] Oithona nana genome sequencing.
MFGFEMHEQCIFSVKFLQTHCALEGFLVFSDSMVLQIVL